MNLNLYILITILFFDSHMARGQSSKAEQHSLYLQHKSACQAGDAAACIKLNERNTTACNEGELDACYQLGLTETQKKNVVRAHELFIKACEGGHRPACSLAPKEQIQRNKQAREEVFSKKRAELKKKTALSPSYIKRIQTEIPNNVNIQNVVMEKLIATHDIYLSLNDDDLWIASRRDQIESDKCLEFLIGEDKALGNKITELVASFKKDQGIDEKLETQNFGKIYRGKTSSKAKEGLEEKDPSLMYKFCHIKLEKEFIAQQSKMIRDAAEKADLELYKLPEGGHPFTRKIIDYLQKEVTNTKRSPGETAKYTFYTATMFVFPSLDQGAREDLVKFDKACPGVSDKTWEACKQDQKYNIFSSKYLPKTLCLQDNKNKVNAKCFEGFNFSYESMFKEYQKIIPKMPFESMTFTIAEEKESKCEVPPELKNGIITFKEEVLVIYDLVPYFTRHQGFRHLISRRYHNEWEMDYDRGERRYQFYSLPNGAGFKAIDCLEYSSVGGSSSHLVLQGESSNDVYAVDRDQLAGRDEPRVESNSAHYLLFAAIAENNLEKIKMILPSLKTEKFSEISYKKFGEIININILELLFKELPQIDVSHLFIFFDGSHLKSRNDFIANKDQALFYIRHMSEEPKKRMLFESITRHPSVIFIEGFKDIKAGQLTNDERFRLTQAACTSEVDRDKKLSFLENTGILLLKYKYKEQGHLIQLAHSNSRFESLRCAEYFVKNGENINEVDDKGNSALHYAAMNGDREFVTTFVALGSKKDIKNKEGKIPYDYVEKSKGGLEAAKPYLLKLLEVN